MLVIDGFDLCEIAAVLAGTNCDRGRKSVQCGIAVVNILLDTFRECADFDTVWIYMTRMFNAASRFPALDMPRPSFHPAKWNADPPSRIEG
jgi:hypothetical protein